jgi:uncharacterized protein
VSVFGVEVFAGLLAWHVVALAIVYAAAFFVKGVFGYGAIPVLIVAGSFLVEPHHAVVLAAVTNLATHVQYLPRGFRHGKTDLVLSLAVYLVPAIAIGVWVFAQLDGASLSVLAGAIILASVIADARGTLDPLAPWVRQNTRIAAPVFGTFAGLVSGIVGSGAIAFITLYVRIFAQDRHSFSATIILVTAVILVWRTAALTYAGEITWVIVGEALLLLPGGLLAGWIGARVASRLSDRLFFRFYRAVLVLGAALMMLRGLFAGG